MTAIRWTIAAVSAVVLLVGIVAVLTPVSVSPAGAVVSCGSVPAPDLSEARSPDIAPGRDDAEAADPDYPRLCRMELEDRRLGSTTMVGFGALILSATVAWGVVARRRRQRSAADA